MSCNGCYFKNKNIEINSTWNYLSDKSDCQGLYDLSMCRELQKLGELKKQNELHDKLYWKSVNDALDKYKR
jgi:hypothetical protein